MKRLAIISTQVMPWGGSEELWADVALAARRGGIAVEASVTQACEQHPRIAELAHAGVRFHFRATKHPGPPGMWPRAARFIGRRLGLPAAKSPPEKVWEAVFAERPDAVLISQGGAYCGLGLPGLPEWLRQSGVPYVPLCQSARSQWLVDEALRGQAETYFTAAARVAFVSAVNGGSVRVELAAPLQNAVVVQNPVGFPPEQAFPWPSSPGAELACVARLEVDDKGQDLLLQALAKPVWRQRDFTLTFYGQGRDEAYLKRLSNYLGISQSVRWGGLLRGTAGIWEKCQLLVLPSRSEGTPLVLLEAMAAGRPAVVTAVDGNLEWVEDGVTGFVAEAATVRHLSLALERAWAERGDWLQMGSAARERFLTRRDPDPAGTLLQVLVSAARPGA